MVAQSFLTKTVRLGIKKTDAITFCAYTQLKFQKALAEVDCEIRIDFADDGKFIASRISFSKTY